jgi:hybrid cluster-associated redox disulfide protein
MNNAQILSRTKVKLNPDIGIVDLVETYPEVVEVLQSDYNFHCVNCLFSEFDTLRQGAEIHGIDGQDFDDLVSHLESIINGDNVN